MKRLQFLAGLFGLAGLAKGQTGLVSSALCADAKCMYPNGKCPVCGTMAAMEQGPFVGAGGRMEIRMVPDPCNLA